MKRKLMYNDGASIYGAPALESTLLLETGGLDDKNSIGELPSTNISAAVSSGSRTFQYNRYFWNKELFSFNYTNNAVGIAIAYYRGVSRRYAFCIYPILLPRVSMTLLQSITSSPTDDPAARRLLLEELVYYLNLGFTSYGVGDNYQIQPQGDGFKLAPWVTAIDAKGSPYSPHDGSLIVDNDYMPIFQDGANEPPLIWSYSGNNGQLCLRINDNFIRFGPDQLNERDYIGFQIISLEPYMTDAPFVSDPSYAFSGFRPADEYYMNFNGAPEASYGSGVGWCSQGAFATGFGQKQYYTNAAGRRENDSTYGDIYTSAERRQLWEATKFPLRTINTISVSEFFQLCKQFKLVSNTGCGSGILVSHFITSLIPERFFSIESDALTRNQKRPISSNNITLPPGAMAVQFITLDSLRTWEDNTVAGQSSSAGSILFGSRKSGIDDCSIVALDPMQSLQTIDLILKDEWGNTLKNYMELNGLTAPQAYDIMGPFELFAVIPASLSVAAWVLPYNPIPSANDESILINESWWCSAYQFYAFNPLSTAVSHTPVEFAPSFPRSTTFSHFGRVLGY